MILLTLIIFLEELIIISVKQVTLAFKYSGYRDKYTYPSFLTQKELDDNRRQSGNDKEAKENNRIKKDEFTLTYNTKIGDKNDLNILGFIKKQIFLLNLLKIILQNIKEC